MSSLAKASSLFFVDISTRTESRTHIKEKVLNFILLQTAAKQESSQT